MLQIFDSSSLTRKAKNSAKLKSGLLEVKSKYGAEFRRFPIEFGNKPSLKEFTDLIRSLHNLTKVPFDLTYTDREGDLLPINNEENYHHALLSSRPLLRVIVQNKGNNPYEIIGYGNNQPRKNLLSRFMEPQSTSYNRNPKMIGLPENFRAVSAIIDVDILPTTQRRVKLMKSQSDKPLGFFVRDGFSYHPTTSGKLERIPGIFISRLTKGGLAESTGLLAVNDEVLEVNGIEVAGKSLDQVTDMMVANSANLIITIKPSTQNTTVEIINKRNSLIGQTNNSGITDLNSSGRLSSNQKQHHQSTPAISTLSEEKKEDEKEEEDDEVVDFVRENPSGSSSEKNNFIINQKKQNENPLQQFEYAQNSLQQSEMLNHLRLNELQSEHQTNNENIDYPYQQEQNSHLQSPILSAKQIDIYTEDDDFEYELGKNKKLEELRNEQIKLQNLQDLLKLQQQRDLISKSTSNSSSSSSYKSAENKIIQRNENNINEKSNSISNNDKFYFDLNEESNISNLNKTTQQNNNHFNSNTDYLNNICTPPPTYNSPDQTQTHQRKYLDDRYQQTYNNDNDDHHFFESNINKQKNNIIYNLQSLNELNHNNDLNNYRFYEKGLQEKSDQNFTSNDFYNFSNSSLRNFPNKNKTNNRTSTRSVGYTRARRTNN